MQHRSTLSRGFLSVTLFVLMLLFFFGSSAFTPNTATPKITWTPGVVDQTLAPGTTYNRVVSFMSTENISHTVLTFTPSLQGVLVVSPTEMSAIKAGVSYNVRLTVTIPVNTQRQEYNGELMLRIADAALADSLKLRFRVGTPTQAPDSFQLIDAALARGEISVDHAALYEVYALFASPRLPPKYRSDTLIPNEGTDALLYALRNWNQLKPETQRTIADFLTPKPVKGSPRSVKATVTPISAVAPQVNATPTAAPTATLSNELPNAKQQGQVQKNNQPSARPPMSSPAVVNHSTFAIGDVFAAVGNGQVAWYNPDGTLNQVLNTGLGGFTTGMAFDTANNLYVTDFSAANVSKFDSTGKLLGTFGSNHTISPESTVFDAAGNAYVGYADGDRQIRKFAASGNLLAQFAVATENRGSDWIDLAADQCTIFYTSEGKAIKRFNVCTNTQLADFVSALPGSFAYAVRLLPNGEMLVADTEGIFRLNASGSVVKAYDVLGENCWFALSLDSDGTSFWAGDACTGHTYKFDIAKGTLQLGPIATCGFHCLFGLAVFGARTQAQPTPTPTNTPTRTPTPTVTPISSLAKDVAGCTLDRQDATATHFVIWYTTTGPCAIQVPPGTTVADYLNALKDGLERAYDKYGNGSVFFNGNGLHYRFNGLPALYQVFVVPMRVSIAGLNFPLPAAGLTLPSAIFMPNAFSADLSAKAAHEFFHAVQWTYQPCLQVILVPLAEGGVGVITLPSSWGNEDVRWWMEATAEWAQHEVFPNDTTYTSFIPVHLNNIWVHMDTRPPQGGSGIPYSPLFPFYLIEKLQPGQINKDIIRMTWAEYDQRGNCGSMKTVINNILPPKKKITDIFPDYAGTNYFLAYPPPPDIRTDLLTQRPDLPQDFRPAFEPAFFNDRTLGLAGPSSSIYGGTSIDPLGAAYVEFTRGFAQTNMGRALEIAVQIPVSNPSIPPVVRVWKIGNNFPPPPNSPPVSTPVPLMNISGTWNGSIRIPDFDSDQVQRVVMVVVNPQTGGPPLEWHYQGNVR